MKLLLVERNDESFIFVLDIVDNVFRKISMYPVILSECRTNLARGDRAVFMAERMTRLCRELGSPAVWNEQLGTLNIEIGAKEKF